jgi:hypothetical protein
MRYFGRLSQEEKQTLPEPDELSVGAVETAASAMQT